MLFCFSSSFRCLVVILLLSIISTWLLPFCSSSINGERIPPPTLALEFPEFDVRSFGAVPDGKTLTTHAFEKAVEAASNVTHSVGSAIVRVPFDPTTPSSYLIGSFSLASHLTLFIEPGATLLASTNPNDYLLDWNWDPALVDTKNATQVTITGGGKIDGQAPGKYWSTGFDPKRNYFIPRTWKGLGGGCVGECRPKLVRFTDCANIMLQNVSLVNSPDWTILFRRSQNISMRNMYVFGDSRWPNNDGVDLESCENVDLSNSIFDVGDDGIVLSSGNTNPQRVPFLPQPPPPTRNITGNHLKIRSHSSAIKFEAIFAKNHSDISEVHFEDVEIINSSRGIGFQQRTGSGVISNISFVNVSIVTEYPTGSNWWGSGEPIWITNVAENDNDTNILSGSIQNISFVHVNMWSENSVLVSGRTQSVGPIRFQDCTLNIVVRSNCTCSKGNQSIVPFQIGCRDYRPLERTGEDAVILDSTSGFAFEGTGNVIFGDNVSVKFIDPKHNGRPSWWNGKCVQKLSYHSNEITSNTMESSDRFVVSGHLKSCVGELPKKWNVAGITFTSGRYCPNVTMSSDEGLWSLFHLASTGASHVAFVTTSYQHSINTTDIFPLYNASQVPPEYYVYVTVKDDDLVSAIRYAKYLGLSVLLKPHVDPLTDNAPIGNTWRGDIGKYFNESQWNLWFESYWKMFSKYAHLAYQENVDFLSMNCELITANNQTNRWRKLISQTREIVGDKVLLTTSPNGHGHENWVEWFDMLDVIGVDWYDHVNGTTLQEMINSWNVYLKHLKGLSEKFGKKLMMTEMGYCSGPHGSCGRQKKSTVESLKFQAMHYEALFLATAGRESWFLGGFWWNWDADPAVGYGDDAGDECLNPSWKPAEDVLRKYYRAVGQQPALPGSMNKSQCICTA